MNTFKWSMAVLAGAVMGAVITSIGVGVALILASRHVGLISEELVTSVSILVSIILTLVVGYLLIWYLLDVRPFNTRVEEEEKVMSEEKKAKLTGLFRDNPETPEGKYLVKRRDGSVPPWPSFVLGGADPHAEAALRAYADSCEADPAMDPGFIAAVRRWADEYRRWRETQGPGDPGMGRHRVDDSNTVAEMKKGRSA